MSKKSPLKQFQNITPTTSELDDALTNVIEKPDWLVSYDDVKDLKAPSYQKLSEKEFEDIFIKLKAKGYSTDVIKQTIQSINKDKHNAYSSGVKKYNEKWKAYGASENKLLNLAFNKQLEKNPDLLEEQQEQLKVQMKKSRIETGEFGEFKSIYTDAAGNTKDASTTQKDFSKIIAPSANWDKNKEGKQELTDNILDFRNDDFVAGTLSREYGDDFRFENTSSFSDGITVIHKKSGKSIEIETNMVGSSGEIESAQKLIDFMEENTGVNKAVEFVNEIEYERRTDLDQKVRRVDIVTTEMLDRDEEESYTEANDRITAINESGDLPDGQYLEVNEVFGIYNREGLTYTLHDKDGNQIGDSKDITLGLETRSDKKKEMLPKVDEINNWINSKLEREYVRSEKDINEISNGNYYVADGGKKYSYGEMVAKWQEENFSNGVVYNGKEDEKLMHDDFQSWVYNEVGVSLNTKDIATLSYEDEYYKTYYKTPKGRTENTLFHLANASEVELTDALNKLNGINASFVRRNADDEVTLFMGGEKFVIDSKWYNNNNAEEQLHEVMSKYKEMSESDKVVGEVLQGILYNDSARTGEFSMFEDTDLNFRMDEEGGSISKIWRDLNMDFGDKGSTTFNLGGKDFTITREGDNHYMTTESDKVKLETPDAGSLSGQDWTNKVLFDYFSKNLTIDGNSNTAVTDVDRAILGVLREGRKTGKVLYNEAKKNTVEHDKGDILKQLISGDVSSSETLSKRKDELVLNSPSRPSPGINAAEIKESIGTDNEENVIKTLNEFLIENGEVPFDFKSDIDGRSINIMKTIEKLGKDKGLTSEAIEELKKYIIKDDLDLGSVIVSAGGGGGNVETSIRRKENWRDLRYDNLTNFNVEDFLNYSDSVTEDEAFTLENIISTIDDPNSEFANLMSDKDDLNLMKEYNILAEDEYRDNYNVNFATSMSIDRLFSSEKIRQTEDRIDQINLRYEVESSKASLELNLLAKQMKEDGCYIVQDGDGFRVEGSGNVKKWKNEFDSIEQHQEEITNRYKDHITNSENNLLYKQHGRLREQDDQSDLMKIDQANTVLSASQKRYGFWNNFGQASSTAFQNMVLAVPMLFDVESAHAAYRSNIRSQEIKLPTKMDYAEAIEAGLKMEFTGRTIGEQSANTVLALATGGSSSLLVTSALFGIQTAGTSLGESKTLQIQASTALTELNDLQRLYREGVISKDKFDKLHKHYTEVYQDSYQPLWAQYGAAITKGVAEGFIMQKFGTAINARAVLGSIGTNYGVRAAIKNATTVGEKMLIGSKFLGKTIVEQVGGEIIEETAAEIAQSSLDFLFNDVRKYANYAEQREQGLDYSGMKEMFYNLDDVIVSSIINSGSMSGVSVPGTFLHSIATHQNQEFVDNIATHQKTYLDIINDLKKLEDVGTKENPGKDFTKFEKLQNRLANVSMAIDQAGRGASNDLVLLAKNDKVAMADHIADNLLMSQIINEAGIKNIVGNKPIDQKRIRDKIEKKLGVETLKQYDDLVESISDRFKGIKYNSDSAFDLFGHRGEIEHNRRMSDGRFTTYKNADARTRAAMINQHMQQVFVDQAVKDFDINATDEYKLHLEKQIYTKKNPKYNKKEKESSTNPKTIPATFEESGLDSRDVKKEKELKELFARFEYIKRAAIEVEIDAARANQKGLLKEISGLDAGDVQTIELPDVNDGVTFPVPTKLDKKYQAAEKAGATQKELSDILGEIANDRYAQITEWLQREMPNLTYEQASGMAINFIDGKTNGLLFGNKYIVNNKGKADQDLLSGRLQAGTVYYHEPSHVTDNLAFQDKQGNHEENLIIYAENLWEYMVDALPEVHAKAMRTVKGVEVYGYKFRLNVDGNMVDSEGNVTKNREIAVGLPWSEQDFTAKDEYTKAIQDEINTQLKSRNILDQKDYDPAIDEFLKRGEGAQYKILMATKINTPNKAANYLARFMVAARRGELSTQGRKMIAGKKLVQTEESQLSRVSKQSTDLLTKEKREILVREVNESYGKLKEAEKQLVGEKDELVISVLQKQMEDARNEIIENYRDMAEKRYEANIATGIEKGIDVSKLLNDDTKQLIVSDMLYDPGTKKVDEETDKETGAKARSVLGMIEDFEVEKHKYGNLAAYINFLFKRRSYAVFTKYSSEFNKQLEFAEGEIFVVDEEFDTNTELNMISKGDIVLNETVAENDPNEVVGVKAKQHTDNVQDVVSKNPSEFESKTFKQMKDLDVQSTVDMMVGGTLLEDGTIQRPVFIDDGSPVWGKPEMKKLLGTSIADSIVKKLKNNANLNSQEIKALQSFVRRHTTMNPAASNLLWKAFPQGYELDVVKTKEGGLKARPGKSTGLNRVLLELGYNISSKRIGNGYPQYKKPTTGVGAVSEVDFQGWFGINPRGEADFLGREQNVSDTLKAFVRMYGGVTTKQAAKQWFGENGTDLTKQRLAFENGMSDLLFSQETANNLEEFPNLRENNARFLSLLTQYYGFNTYFPTMKYTKGEKDLKGNIFYKINKKQVLEFMKEAGIPDKLHNAYYDELYGATGQIANIALYKRNRTGANVKGVDILPGLIETMDGRVDDALALKKVQDLIGSDKNNAEIYNDPDTINMARDNIKKEVLDKMAKLGIEPTKKGWGKASLAQKTELIQFVVDNIGSYARAAQIGNRSISINEEGGQAFKIEYFEEFKTSDNRKQVTEGVGDYAALINQVIPGVTILPVMNAPKRGKQEVGKRSMNGITRRRTEIRDTTIYELSKEQKKVVASMKRKGATQKEIDSYKHKNGKQIGPDGMDKIYPGLAKSYSEKTEAVSKELKFKDGKITFTTARGRKNQAIRFREVYKLRFANMLSRLGNKADMLGKYDAQMFFGTESSDMTAVGRRSAYLYGVTQDISTLKNLGKTMEYDHAKPNNTLLIRSAELMNEVQKGKITIDQALEQLDIFFEDYHVNAIPKTMDDAIKTAGYQSLLTGKYKPGSPVENLGWSSRIYNEVVKFDPRLRPIMVVDPDFEGNVIGNESVLPKHRVTATSETLVKQSKSFVNPEMSVMQYQNHNIVKKGVLLSRSINHETPSRGMSAFDFDETLIDKGENTIIATRTIDKKITKASLESFSDAELVKLADALKDPEYLRPLQNVANEFYFESANRNDLMNAIVKHLGTNYGKPKTLREMTEAQVVKIAELMKDPEYFRPVQNKLNEFSFESANLNDLIKAIEVQRKKKYSEGINKILDIVIGIKEEQKISSSNWPIQGPQLAADGYEFDFSDFINVKGGVEGPLMQKFRNRIKKYGIDNNYILTARPAEAAPAIQAWLKQQGIDMPIENITGLGNSTGEAKAMWMAQKFSEGYNDMYFVDDALPNVKAVADMLEQLDIKGSSVQAKIQFSRTMDSKFNQALDNNFQAELDLNRILEQTKGVKAEAVFSDAQAKIRGSAKGKWKFWVPYSAEDFKGLVYRFVGKGRQGEAQMAFFKKALFDPFGRAHEAMNVSKQQLNNQYKELLKQFPNVKKELSDKLDDYTGFEGNQFTVDQAIRVYLWNKNGMEVPGLSQRDLKALVNFVQSDAELRSFAENLALITNQELGYLEPTEYWTVENIDSDINTINNEINREDHLAEWRQNKEIMFGVWGNDGRLVGDNINKIEAIYGTRFREALEDILYRMEFGRKREAGSNRLVNAFNNWANQSVGAIMFFNMRSALLQTISSINYLNWSDNNPLKAGGALLNFPQFLKDFTMIFNSDMLKQRRAGNQRGINEAELAQAVDGVGIANRVKAMLNYLLTKGFLPTQIADSFAISSGGATFYRNRVNTYLKQGMTQEQAETKAFQDFAENTEESQQSSRADMISQQQASPLGRYILAFKNTPMQYARLTKKAFLDLANGRGDAKTNVGKIIYYMGVQNLIFSALQTALGALIGGDEDEEKEKAFERTANSMIDSILGGLGFGGNVALTLKNVILEYNKQEGKGWNADHTYTILKFFGLSPTISSKGRKLYSAIQTRKFNKEVMKEMDLLDIDNPMWSVIANIVSATTNLPLDRLVKKVDNIDAALTEDITALQRFALLMGWNTWDLKIDDSDVVAVEDEIKEKKEVEKKKKKKIKKEEKKKEKEAEEEVIEKSFIEDQKKEREEGKKDITCVAVNKSGKRCKTKVDGNNTYCTIHVKVDQGTKEVQCKKIKSDKKRCKMKTKAKSGLCYYHD